MTELDALALRKVHEALPAGCCEAVSTNRTFEIGRTPETGRPYRSIAYLLEECSRGRAKVCEAPCYMHDRIREKKCELQVVSRTDTDRYLTWEPAVAA